MPQTYTFRNSMSTDAVLEFDNPSNIPPIYGERKTVLRPGELRSYTLNETSNAGIKITCTNGRFLFPNGFLSNKKLEMGFCSTCTLPGFYEVVANAVSPYPPANWTGENVRNLEIGRDPSGNYLTDLVHPVYGKYIVLVANPLEIQDDNVSLAEIKVEVYETGGTNWFCRIAQQSTPATCRLHIKFYSTADFLNTLPAEFTQIYINAGQATFIDWKDGLGPLGAANYANLYRGEIYYQSTKGRG